MTTPYIDPNLIFAENAPTQDKPAAFSNYDKGWDESRKNDGRPLIPQMNYLTQQADLKNLYIHENGAALPYKEGIAYEENAVVVKDGVLQQWRDGVWNQLNSASAILDASGASQQDINDYTGAKWRNKAGGYALNARVMLEDGNIVRSTVAGNTVDPNVDMTGWVHESVKTVQETAFTLTPQMFGAKGDGVTDDYDAFFECFNAFPELAALNIYIPPRTYKISKTLFITRPHKISGPSGMENIKSVLDFSGATVDGLPDIKGALWVYHTNTASVIPLPTGQVGSYGAGARIDGIAVINSPADGIVLNAPAKVSNSHAILNGGDGIRIYGGVGVGNANHSFIIHTKCSSNGGSGIRVAGSNGNAFTIIGCMVNSNAHYGINDASLLGGVVIGCEADGNGLAAYNQRGGPVDNSGLSASPSRTVWVGNYVEGNQPYNYSLNSRGTVIGATGTTPEAGVGFLAGSVAGMYSARTLVVAEDEQKAYDENAAFGKFGAGLLKMGWNGVSQKFRVTHSSGYINIGTDEGSGNQISLRVGSNFNNAVTLQRPYFPNGFALSANHAQTSASAAPTTGSYERGHIVWNTNPVAGGFAGWICVTAGSPGVWKTFGAISA